MNYKGITYIVINGRLVFQKEHIGIPNENLNLHNNKKTVGQEYSQECDEDAWINREKRA